MNLTWQQRKEGPARTHREEGSHRYREEGQLLLELWDWNRGLGDDFLGRFALLMFGSGFELLELPIIMEDIRRKMYMFT